MVVLSVILTFVLSIKFCSKSKFITIYPPLHIHPTVKNSYVNYFDKKGLEIIDKNDSSKEEKKYFDSL